MKYRKEKNSKKNRFSKFNKTQILVMKNSSDEFITLKFIYLNIY